MRRIAIVAAALVIVAGVIISQSTVADQPPTATLPPTVAPTVETLVIVTATEPPTVTPDPIPVWEPLDDVPLDAELQQYIHDACEVYGVDEALVLGIIERESTFRPEAENEYCWGLMQIHKINYDWLRDEEGIDPLTYPGNIDAGVLMISRLLEKYEDTHKALMAYNCGESGARRLWEQGYTTTEYSRAVVMAAENWKTILS